jgi:hypothetical protein
LNTTTGTSITSGSVTNSSPWYDYASDTVYAGDDAGNLFKVTPVLGSGTLVVTGLNIVSTVGTHTSVMTGPVYDSHSDNIFVGATNGVLYGMPNSTFPTVTPSTLQVGKAGCAAGWNGSDNSLIDPPIVDSTNSWVYEWATTGSNGTNTVVVQVSTTLPFTAPTTVNVGEGDPTCTNQNYDGTLTGGFPAHAPEFDNAYYTGDLSHGHMWVCGRPSNSGTSSGESNAAFWAIPTSGTGALTQPSGNVFVNGFDSNGAQCSPFTEIFQPNISGGTDYIFFGEGDNNASDFQFGTLYGIIVSGTSYSYVLPPASSPAYPNANGGTSGIVIDNVKQATGSYPEALSIYFTTLAPSTTVCGSTSAYCAIKLTQSALQ